MRKYLTFKEVTFKGQDTKIFQVISSRNKKDCLGLIFWSYKRKKYVFEAYEYNVFSAGCLVEISNFIVKLK